MEKSNSNRKGKSMRNLCKLALLIVLSLFRHILMADADMLGNYAIKDDPDTAATEGNLSVDGILSAKTVSILNDMRSGAFTLNKDGIKGYNGFSLMAGNGYVEDSSLALGSYNNVKQKSIAAGEENQIENTSMAIGSYNVVKDWYWPNAASKGGNALIGTYNSAKDVPSGDGYYDSEYFTSCSLAAGNYNKIGGMASIALGYGNISESEWHSSGDNNISPAISIGRKNTAVDNSIMIGDGNVGHANSYSLGAKLHNYAAYMTSLGRLNSIPSDVAASSTGWNLEDPLIVIGNGYVDGNGTEVRSDAFVLKKSGDAVLNGNFKILKPSSALPMGRFGKPVAAQADE